jgi:hypothetical protein
MITSTPIEIIVIFLCLRTFVNALRVPASFCSMRNRKGNALDGYGPLVLIQKSNLGLHEE